MAVGDLHQVDNRVGALRWRLTYRELVGHDPANDFVALALDTPIEATGVGVLALEFVDPSTKEMRWAADFDVCTRRDEWDTFAVPAARRLDAADAELQIEAWSGSDAEPPRPREPGQARPLPRRPGGRGRPDGRGRGPGGRR